MSIIIDSDFKFLGESIERIAIKDDVTNIDYRLPSDQVVYGATLMYNRAKSGDSISLHIVDKDNILGYGENFVLATWIKKWFVDPNKTSMQVVSEFGGTVSKDLYVRVCFTNTDEVEDVDIKINFFMLSR